jgi:hypothetical protein
MRSALVLFVFVLLYYTRRTLSTDKRMQLSGAANTFQEHNIIRAW